MILTCPQCATRYQIDDSKFPPRGRKVRCVKCGHVWFQAAPTPELEPAPLSGPQSGTDLHDSMAGARQPSARKRQQVPGERMAVAAGWIGLIAVLGLIAWGVVHYRDTIAKVWPQTASLYAALGFPANNRGIAFESVNTRRETQGGQSVLIVNGILVNVGARDLALPQIQVVLSDDRQRSVDGWMFAPPQERLKPGARMIFTTRRINPPPSARHLDIRFAGAPQ